MDEETKLLKNEVKKLSKEVAKLNKAQKKNNKLLKSYYDYFNNLYLDFDLKPKGALKLSQELCLDLLDFISLVCMKHGLKWWLDYGDLLGAVRHKDFIPWDDDVDISMTRADSYKFMDVIDDELKSHGLDDIIKVVPQRLIREDSIIAFTQISITHEHGLYAGLDIFPIDFTDHPPKDVAKECYDAKCEYHIDLINGMDKAKAIDKIYEKYGLSFETQQYFWPSMESYWGNTRKFTLFETDKLFPLRKTEFKDRLYPCPNDVNYYVAKSYGNDYHDVPKVVKVHKRVYYLKRKPNFEINFKMFARRLKEANRKFFTGLLDSWGVVYYRERAKKEQNIDQKIPIEHTVKFTLKRDASSDCRAHVQIGKDWNNSVFIGQVGAGNTFGFWLRRDGVTDKHHVHIPSNEYVDVEYSYKEGVHTLKVDEEIVTSFTSFDYEYDNLLNIVIDDNSSMSFLMIS